MPRSRFLWLTALALALLGVQAGRLLSQDLPAPRALSGAGQEARTSERSDSTCTVYALADLVDDPDFGKWIADTIPQVIRPGTWNQGTNQKRKLSYFAPGKILVVYHTPAVQAEVAAFLQNVRKALARQVAAARDCERAARPDSGLVRARYAAPNLIQPAAAAPSAYPVPAPVKPPKHLFHFIIHYDGEGAADSDFTGLIKALNGVSEEKDTSAAKAKADRAGAPPSRQSFNFIIRYEGEGLIDSTVAGVLKEIYGGPNGPASGRWNMTPVGPGCCPTPAAGATSGSALGAAAGALLGAAPKPATPPARPVAPGTFATTPSAPAAAGSAPALPK
jgi:hypothetical protein